MQFSCFVACPELRRKLPWIRKILGETGTPFAESSPQMQENQLKLQITCMLVPSRA